MRSPTTAFAWELWHKHRSRLVAIICMLLGFITVYPRLCAMAGFDPGSSASLNHFVGDFKPTNRGGPVLFVGHAVFFLFLLAGPITAMFLSLLCLTWMFTVLEFDPTGRNPDAIPARVFTLPISTSFLFLWLLLGGLGTVIVVFETWIHFVQMPYLDVFGEYQRCIGWMAFLSLTQAITWSLSGWPITRLFALLTLLFCFLYYPAWHDIIDSLHILPFLFVLGVAVAGVSLGKMRHGQWKGWAGKGPLVGKTARRGLRGPARFASPAQAQLWFEWRRFARTSSIFVAALVIVPVVVHLGARVVFAYRPLQDDTLFGLTMVLLAIPVVMYNLFAASPSWKDHSFLMNRPLTSGQMTMAILKAAAVSTALSWVVVFAGLAAMPLLGDFRSVEESVSTYPMFRAALVIGLIFLTWRSFTVNLCFARSGVKWLADMPILIFLGVVVCVIMLTGLKSNEAFRGPVMRFIPFIPALLACLVAVKFSLAFLGFRVSIKRGLLVPSSVLGYLAAWVSIVVALSALVLNLPLAAGEWVLPVSLCVVLLVPLARISFCPIAIEHSRHG